MGIRRRSRLAGVAAIAIAATGCFWTSPGAGPSRTGHNAFEDEITPETVADLEEIWAVDADPPAIVLGVVTSNRAVHFIVRSTDGPHLYGIDRTDGSEMWKTPIGLPGSDNMDVSLPIFAHDAIWVSYGSRDLVERIHRIGRFDPDSGELEETVSDSGGLVDGVRGSRYVTQKLVAQGGIPSFGALAVSVRDLEDPEVGWDAYIFGREGTSNLGNTGRMTLGHNAVYQAGNGYFEDEDGNYTEGNGLRSYAIEGSGTCAEDESPPCLPTWAVALDGTRASAPVVARQEDSLDDGTIFTTTDAGTVYAVDATSGDVTWSVESIDSPARGPALADGVLYVPTSAGTLVAMDAGTGDILWEASAGEGAIRSPAVAGGVVYTASGDTVHAFDASGCGQGSCDALWSASTGSQISSGPAVDRGHLYVGTQDGRLIAYGLPD